jgi:hypothetical protein
MYELSFSEEFYTANMEVNHFASDAKLLKPISVYEGLIYMYINSKDEFIAMVLEVLNVDLNKYNYTPDEVIPDLLDKVREYNTCENLNSPVKVFINEDYSVLVYDYNIDNNIETKETDTAFLNNALPCNPNPFINRLKELVANDMNYIKSDHFKANLWILLVQSYGEFFNINCYNEFERLKEKLN